MTHHHLHNALSGDMHLYERLLVHLFILFIHSFIHYLFNEAMTVRDNQYDSQLVRFVHVFSKY